MFGKVLACAEHCIKDYRMGGYINFLLACHRHFMRDVCGRGGGGGAGQPVNGPGFFAKGEALPLKSPERPEVMRQATSCLGNRFSGFLSQSRRPVCRAAGGACGANLDC